MSDKEFIVIIKSRDIESGEKLFTRKVLKCPGCQSETFSHANTQFDCLYFICPKCDEAHLVSDLIMEAANVEFSDE